MKVMKFGGTSVGSVDSILALKKIVESSDTSVVVVVSALGGITDKLIATSRLALSGDKSYTEEFCAMVCRHHDMIDTIIADEADRKALLEYTDALFDELKSIYLGVFLVHEMSERTIATIVSYGERLSSRIVATLINGAEWFDSRKFIKTETKHGRYILNADMTERLVKGTFRRVPKVSVVPGFIAKDGETGEVTNLGRGGSDYTAAIIAAALDAEALEIWTDVNGFMTADPRVITSAYTIRELSYTEAMELCNFGAKVIYPPTIYPVCQKNIPIYVKNTFNPKDEGTVIKQRVSMSGGLVKGISSMAATSLITVSGLSMVSVIGVFRRMFSCLAENGISVILVSDTSSENSTLIGVRDDDCMKAIGILNKEFAKEIKVGDLFPMTAVSGLTTITVVGENMKHHSGMTGKIFSAVSRAGVTIVAYAHGANETTVSFVVDAKMQKVAMNTIHESLLVQA